MSGAKETGQEKRDRKRALKTQEDDDGEKRARKPDGGSAAPAAHAAAVQDDGAPAAEPGALADGFLVYAGGLPFGYEDNNVRAAFAECGEITHVHCMRFPDTGKFRGIALVTFATEAAAEKAKSWDGLEWEGRFLVMKPGKALPKEAQRAAAAKQPVGALRPDERPKPTGSTTAYVGNLNFDTTQEELAAVFKDFPVAGIRLATDKVNGRPKGFAHVEFEDSDALERAMKLNGVVVRSRELAMHYSTTTGPSAKPRPEPRQDGDDGGRGRGGPGGRGGRGGPDGRGGRGRGGRDGGKVGGRGIRR
ncbi:hypothetical protein T492DRAFT_1056126 [Pavlovales sp. CCMP2436]|nr:hypothetical protein T492DRAFT_1056126 [Pavlovales sp. CCMP2436]